MVQRIAFAAMLLVATYTQAQTPNLPSQTERPNLSHSVDRYQMLQFEGTVLLLDKETGDTWYLANVPPAKPQWSAIPRQAKPMQDSAKQDSAKQDLTIPAPVAQKPIIKSDKPTTVREPKGVPSPGPIDLHLIPNHDIVILRGPRESVEATRQAIKAMQENANPDSATKP